MSAKIEATELSAAATEMGRDFGNSRASWIIDGNSSIEFCQKIIDGFDEGDPEIMDFCPSPLSGEFDGDPTPASVLKDLGLEEDSDEDHSLFLDAYEAGFQDGFWHRLIQDAYRHHGGYDPCGVCRNYGHKSKGHNEE